MSIYKQIYFTLHKLQLSLNRGSTRMPGISAISALLVLNLLSLSFIYDALTGQTVLNGVGLAILFLIGAAIIVGHYWFLVARGRFEVLELIFSTEDMPSRRKRIWYTIFYAGLTFAFLVVALHMLAASNHGGG